MLFPILLSLVLTFLGCCTLTSAWLPTFGKIRGVNLGSQFVVEPWMAGTEWSKMGCDDSLKSEFDCVSKLGQAQANAAWKTHWESWIMKDDITDMKSYGLNTIRIPVGYWMREDLVYSDSEHFPQGGFQYLEKLCGWASDADMYIIIDLHGAPGAQVTNPDTGQNNPNPGFYVDYQYERAYKFLEWMTTYIHNTTEFRGVGMLEIVNEPDQSGNADTDSMRNTYYPTAFDRIRAAEAALDVPADKAIHVQMMNAKWGSGDPTESLTGDDTSRAAYDDHRYLKYDTSVGSNPDDYLQASCSDNRSGNDPTIVGEFSLSPNTDLQDQPDFAPNDANAAWYTKWFEAQVIAYEKQTGWVFWSWKAELNDWRWSYKDAVAAGVISKNLDDVANSSPCSG